MLDALPGDVRAGDPSSQDHPANLIRTLQRVPLPLPNRTALQQQLAQQGVSAPITQWASTNLRATNGDHRWVQGSKGVEQGLLTVRGVGGSTLPSRQLQWRGCCGPRVGDLSPSRDHVSGSRDGCWPGDLSRRGWQLMVVTTHGRWTRRHLRGRLQRQCWLQLSLWRGT